MEKRRKKLELEKETVRTLSADELSGVGGASWYDWFGYLTAATTGPGVGPDPSYVFDGWYDPSYA